MTFLENETKRRIFFLCFLRIFFVRKRKILVTNKQHKTTMNSYQIQTRSAKRKLDTPNSCGIGQHWRTYCCWRKSHSSWCWNTNRADPVAQEPPSALASTQKYVCVVFSIIPNTSKWINTICCYQCEFVFICALSANDRLNVFVTCLQLMVHQLLNHAAGLNWSNHTVCFFTNKLEQQSQSVCIFVDTQMNVAVMFILTCCWMCLCICLWEMNVML